MDPGFSWFPSLAITPKIYRMGKTCREACGMAKMMANFYHPDGRFLFGYDEAHTFPGEMKNTLELLA